MKSALTLSLLQDMGWYQANFSAAEPLIWGANKGCGFYNNPCTCADSSSASNCNWPGVGYTCTTNNVKSCNFDRTSRSVCQIGTYDSALPAYFQYFTNPNLGGVSSVADYCTMVTEYSNGWCADTSNGGPSLLGETYAPGSRCFDSSLIQNGM